jgi:hypothetical protein
MVVPIITPTLHKHLVQHNRAEQGTPEYHLASFGKKRL